MRVHFAAIVVGMILSCGSLPAEAQFFSDIPATDRNATVITDAVFHQLMEGYPGGVFAPDQPLRRVEGIMVTARLLNIALKGFMLLPGTPQTAERLTAPAWADPAAHFLLEHGMWPYTATDDWQPQTPLTRGEFAQLLYRLLHTGASGDTATAMATLVDAAVLPEPWAAPAAPVTRGEVARVLEETLVYLTQHATTEGVIRAFESDEDGTRWVCLTTEIGEGRLCLPRRGVLMAPEDCDLHAGMRIRTLSDAVSSSNHGTYFRVREVTILPAS